MAAVESAQANSPWHDRKRQSFRRKVYIEKVSGWQFGQDKSGVYNLKIRIQIL